jgi:hypothetical protein
MKNLSDCSKDMTDCLTANTLAADVEPPPGRGQEYYLIIRNSESKIDIASDSNLVGAYTARKLM